jgi:hypothetical protein
MKKIIFILIVSITLTSCIKWFGHPKPTPSPNAINLTNLKGKWTFYSDTVIASSGNVASAITHDYNNQAGYYYQFITDSTGIESLGTEPNSQFGFTYKLTNATLTLNFIDVANNPNFKLTTPMDVYISGFSQHKMVFQTYNIDTAAHSGFNVTLRLTR